MNIFRRIFNVFRTAASKAREIADAVIPEAVETALANPQWTDAQKRRFAKNLVSKYIITKYPWAAPYADLAVNFVFEAIRNAVKK